MGGIQAIGAVARRLQLTPGVSPTPRRDDVRRLLFFAWALSVLIFTVEPLPQSVAASTRRPAVRQENGMVINSRAEYFFSTPEGWLLDKSSDYEDLKVVHAESGASFGVNYSRARGTPDMYYLALVMSLESPDNHWLTFGKGPIKLGGREATGFVGTRQRSGKKVKEFTWVALSGEYVYLVSATVDVDKVDARARDIDQMFSSFSWGVPPQAP
jgi:hypothetical protein